MEKKEKPELTSGLEIHQQLNTGKLFCRCPSILRKDKPDFIIERKLHKVAGEGGVVDEAVKHEATQNKKFIYEGYKENTCLVELDEEPPHEINEEALKIAIQISLLLNCEIVPYTQVMRKTVIDGSNVSGFQRTVLIGKGGYLESASGKVGIWYVYLEEDAARKVIDENNKEENVYRLDRVGIPLVEIVTAPDIKNPERCKEVALHIGEVLRACNVRRGIGTIRQDINVSIEGHPRAEIKGFQDPKIFVKVVEKEMERQKKELSENKSKKELIAEVRGANPDASTKFLRPLPGAARMYPETDLPILRISREQINEAKKTLPRLKSDIKGELKNKGLNEELTKLILTKNKLSGFRELLKVYENPNLVAKLLVLWPSEISVKEGKKIENIESKLTLDILETILFAVKKGDIDESQAREALKEVIKGKNVKEAVNIEKVDNLDEEILKIIKEKPGLTKKAYMGLVMSKFKGKIIGKEAMESLDKIVKE